MVKGLVQDDWQEVALRELTARTFVLNFQGAKVAMDAELSTCFMGTAWQILWALFGDYGLKPEEIEVECDGVSAALTFNCLPIPVSRAASTRLCPAFHPKLSFWMSPSADCKARQTRGVELHSSSQQAVHSTLGRPICWV
jgi:hypothetical protein